MEEIYEEIGYGLEGCVYKPGFCKSNHKHPERGYISKVFKTGKNKVDAEIQRYASLNLSAIDPDMKYFISEPEVCDLDPTDSSSFETARKETDCKHIPKAFDNFHDPPLFKLIDFGLSHTDANPPIKTLGSFKYIPPEMYMFPRPGLPDTYSQYYYFFNNKNASGETTILEQPMVEYYEHLTDEEKYTHTMR